MPLLVLDTAERPKFPALSRYQKDFSQNSHKGTLLQPAFPLPPFKELRAELVHERMRHSEDALLSV